MTVKVDFPRVHRDRTKFIETRKMPPLKTIQHTDGSDSALKLHKPVVVVG